MDKPDKSRLKSESGNFSIDLETGNSSRADKDYPKVGVIIPTYNCSQLISLTLESLVAQNYPNFEIIVVDAGSVDRTLDVVNSFKSERISVYTVSANKRYEMLNKGISRSKAEYLNFLFPGDYYIGNTALRVMMDLALDHQKPSMVFCGTLLRPGREDPKILYRHLTLALLKKGMQPTSLQSCWFHNSTFDKIGKFDTELSIRGGYDLLCRYSLYHGLRTVSVNRVFTDFDMRAITRTQVTAHFWETMNIVYKYFGFWAVLKWLFVQQDIKRFFGLWFNSVLFAFLGSKK